MSLLALEHVGKQFGSGVQGRVALRDVSLQISAGELVAVWGRRRSGRSTLLRVAAGIEPPDSGHVLLDGQDMYGLPMRGLDAIGYCRTSFRPSEGQLILDQLLLGQLSRGVSAATARSRATDALRRVEAERLLAARPGDLDAAERVRVAIARVLVRNPRLMVIDEPTIGVDLLSRQGILALLRSLADDGIAVLSSTADSAGLENADRVLSLSDGEVSGSAIPDTASVIPISRRADVRGART
jgi:ABC-type multidrug transport system ATPase subunit